MIIWVRRTRHSDSRWHPIHLSCSLCNQCAQVAVLSPVSPHIFYHFSARRDRWAHTKMRRAESHSGRRAADAIKNKSDCVCVWMGWYEEIVLKIYIMWCKRWCPECGVGAFCSDAICAARHAAGQSLHQCTKVLQCDKIVNKLRGTQNICFFSMGWKTTTNESKYHQMILSQFNLFYLFLCLQMTFATKALN